MAEFTKYANGVGVGMWVAAIFLNWAENLGYCAPYMFD